MRLALAIVIVSGLVVSAIGQDCVGGVCKLRAAMPRLLRVEQSVVAVVAQPTGCGGMVAAPASCGGSVPTVYRRAPLRTLHARLHGSREARRSSGCGGAAASCAGQAPVQPDCYQPTTAPDVSLGTVQPVSYQPRGNSLYDVALASAQYRAANGIKGHSHIDGSRSSGVGWSTHDSMPTTCLGRGGSNYAVVRGRDGWYASKIGN